MPDDVFLYVSTAITLALVVLPMLTPRPSPLPSKERRLLVRAAVRKANTLSRGS